MLSLEGISFRFFNFSSCSTELANCIKQVPIPRECNALTKLVENNPALKKPWFLSPAPINPFVITSWSWIFSHIYSLFDISYLKNHVFIISCWMPWFDKFIIIYIIIIFQFFLCHHISSSFLFYYFFIFCQKFRYFFIFWIIYPFMLFIYFFEFS